MCILLIDDNPMDLKFASRVAREAGFETIYSHPTLAGARRLLDRALRGDARLPDALILDLCLDADSGYELLRIRYLSPALSKIAVIVWSGLDDHNRKICEVFKADAYVPKWTGDLGLRAAMEQLHIPIACHVN